MEVQGKRVTVIGLGRSGFSAAKWLRRQGAEVLVSDLKMERDLDSHMVRELRGIGVSLETGGHRPEAFLQCDLIVISPGVDQDQTPFRMARSRGIHVLGEMELASRWIKTPILAVTGTNGKSTVTSLLGSLVEHGGNRVFVGGNIGTPLMDYLIQGQRADYAVVEVSSFQLDTMETFSPHIALLLNITPDHLDRYADYAAYQKSKLSIFRNQGPRQFAVLNDDDERLSGFRPPGGPMVLRYGMEYREGRHLWKEGKRLVARISDGTTHHFELQDYALPGVHNIQNLMGAVLSALVLGIEPEPIRETIRSFRSLPHRVERISVFKGVSFYDDSKATNLDAAVKSILSFDCPIVLIAGGRHKGADYAPLARVAKGRVRNAVLLGESRRLIADSFKGEIPWEFADDMQDAVARAFASARHGDVVLLAPACSSFDMYRDYAHRGNVFKNAVERLRAGS